MLWSTTENRLAKDQHLLLGVKQASNETGKQRNKAAEK
jgi:hypothetical protein